MKAFTKYVVLLTVLYFMMSLAGILHHELWLDEAQHWLLARDSISVTDLFRNTRLEGHPLLWNLLLFIITRFTSDVFWMQLLHILIATSAVFVFLWKAPFSKPFKTLFIFGYFIIYEYNAISRNYILGVLFLFMAAAVYKERNHKFGVLCFFLALAANVHLMFGIISLAFFGMLLFENYLERKLFDYTFVRGYCLFIIGWLVLYMQLSGTHPDWLLSGLQNVPVCEKFTKGFMFLFKGLFTLPDFRTIHFWNSNIFVNWSKPMAAVFGLLVYALPVVLFSKDRKTLFFVYSALIGAQFFFFFTQRGATRFDGMAYIILVIALWINQNNTIKNNSLNHFGHFFISLKKPIVYAILAVQFFSGICAYIIDWNHPFTASKDAAAFIKSQKNHNEPVVSFSCESTALCAYLEKKAYFLSDGNFHSYCQWDIAGTTPFSDETVFRLLADYMIAHDRAFFISRTPLKPALLQKNNPIMIRPLQSFGENILPNGNYYIFEVSRNLKKTNRP